MPEYLLKEPKSICHIDSWTSLLCKELLLVSICENNLDVHQHSFVVYRCAYEYVLMNVAACGDQKMVLDCPRAVGIESCEVVHMQTGCSSARTVSALSL